VYSVAAALIAYTAAAGLLTVTPGLDTALVLRTAAADGPRPAFLAGIGIASGCLLWGALVAVGLGALLAASELAYQILRFAGAAYLLYLGYRLLRHPRRQFLIEADVAHERLAMRGRAAFVRGALTNLLNPKVGVFYVSFLPQFVPHGAPLAPFILLLAFIHAVLGVAWFVCLITATRPIAQVLRRPSVVPWLDRLTGGVFVAFGLGLALQARRV
jgi:threonine/homoserine/homoserine lactone efflux protein